MKKKAAAKTKSGISQAARRRAARAREEARAKNVADMWLAIAALRARCANIENAVLHLHARMPEEA